MTEGTIAPLVNSYPPALLALFERSADPDAARSYIDEQIRRLQSARNLQAPISKLPTEVLSIIFKLVNGHSQPNRGRGLITVPDVDKIYYQEDTASTWEQFKWVMHVCRAWRSVIVGCPSLWSRIIFLNAAVAEEMLTRSTTSPLTVNIPIQFIKDPSLPDSLLSKFMDMERLQSLDLKLPGSHLDRLLNVTSGAAAPKLHSLSITNDTGSYFDRTPYHLPRKALSVPMPQLRRLDIDNCSVEWDSLRGCVSSELVSLQLSRISSPSEAQFYSLLSLIPNLERLYLDTVLPVTSQDTDSAISLPKLHFCAIRGSSPEQCLTFQRRVSYPTNIAKLAFYLSTTAPYTNVATITAFIHSCGVSVLNSSRSRGGILFKTLSWGVVLGHDLFASFPEYSPAVSINLSSVRLGELWDYPWLDLLSIPGAKTLSVWQSEWRHFGPTSQWSNLFKRHADVQELYIRSRSPLLLFSALSDSVAGDGDHSLTPSDSANFDSNKKQCLVPAPHSPQTFPQSVILPKLVAVLLSDFAEDLDEDANDIQFEGLLKYLVKRRECGLPIQKLSLDFCYYIYDDVLLTLGKEVGEVDWDGQCLERVSDSDDEVGQ